MGKIQKIHLATERAVDCVCIADEKSTGTFSNPKYC